MPAVQINIASRSDVSPFLPKRLWLWLVSLGPGILFRQSAKPLPNPFGIPLRNDVARQQLLGLHGSHRRRLSSPCRQTPGRCRPPPPTRARCPDPPTARCSCRASRTAARRPVHTIVRLGSLVNPDSSDIIGPCGLESFGKRSRDSGCLTMGRTIAGLKSRKAQPTIQQDHH